MLLSVNVTLELIESSRSIHSGVCYRFTIGVHYSMSWWAVCNVTSERLKLAERRARRGRVRTRAGFQTPPAGPAITRLATNSRGSVHNRVTLTVPCSPRENGALFTWRAEPPTESRTGNPSPECERGCVNGPYKGATAELCGPGTKLRHSNAELFHWPTLFYCPPLGPFKTKISLLYCLGVCFLFVRGGEMNDKIEINWLVCGVVDRLIISLNNIVVKEQQPSFSSAHLGSTAFLAGGGSRLKCQKFGLIRFSLAKWSI